MRGGYNNGGSKSRGSGEEGEEKKWRKKGREERLKLNLKMFFPEFIVRLIFVKMFKNLILCRVNCLSTIQFSKKFSFLLIKRTWPR